MASYFSGVDVNEAETAIVLRDRPFWEAADAGLLMLRRWYRPVFVFFLIPYGVIAGCLVTFFGSTMPWVTPLVLWWLGPVWDRWIVSCAAQLFFQPDTGWGALLRRWFKIWQPSLVADLTWRRFSPLGTFLLPVALFEGIRGRERSRRRKWLSHEMSGPLILLGFAHLCALLGVFSSLLMSAVVFQLTTPWSAAKDSDLSGVSELIVVAIALVQPVYALSNFGLYINTRTRREGWDLAIAFRALRKSLKQLGPVASILIVGLLLAGAPQSAQAQASPFPSASPQSPSEATWDKVVELPEFGGHETKWNWKLKKPLAENSNRNGSSDKEPSQWLAESLRLFAIVLGVAGLTVLVVLGLVRALRNSPRSGVAKLPSPFGDTAAANRWEELVETYCQQGRFRDAVAVLYRETLSLANRSRGLVIPLDATEGDVLRFLRLSTVDAPFATLTRSLISLWQETAWAGREPSEERVRSVLAQLRSAETGVVA